MPNDLDQDALNLTKAIRQRESGGNYAARGASGEAGAYQWTKPTWQSHAQKFLGDPNAKLTRENQNKAAYSQVKEWKDQGYKPDQIASMWNSGKPDYQGNVGVNKMGVKYDTPAYVKGVYSEYQKIKGTQPQTPQQPQGGQTYAKQDLTQQPEEPKEPMGGLRRGLDTVLGGGTIGDAIGTQIAKGRLGTGLQKFAVGRDLSPDEEKNVSDGPTGKQIAGDVLRTGSTFFPVGRATGAISSRLAQEGVKRAGVARAMGTIASGAGAGYTMDVGENFRQGETGTEAFKPGVGTAIGGGLGAVGSAVGAGVRNLANRTGHQRLDDLARNLRTTSQLNLDQTRRGRSPLDVLKEEKLLPEVIDSKTDTSKMVQALDQRIEDAARTTRATLENSGLVVPFRDFEKKIVEAVRNDVNIRNLGQTDNALKQLSGILKSYRGSYGNNVPVTVIDDIRQAMNRNKWKPETHDIYRAIGDAARKIVYDAVPDQQVKTLLQREGELLGAREMAEALNSRAVKSGLLGKHFESVVGGIAGAGAGASIPFGIGPGAIIGALAARKAGDIARKSYFKTPVADLARKVLQKTEGKAVSPGDALLRTQMGQRLEASVKDSVQNPAMGLSIRDVSKGGNLREQELKQTHARMMDQLQQARSEGNKIGERRLEKAIKDVNNKMLQARQKGGRGSAFAGGIAGAEDEDGDGKMDNVDPMKMGIGMLAAGTLGKAGKIAKEGFKNFPDLSTKLLAKLEGRTTVSKQFISDLTNSPDLKQPERDLFRKMLEEEGDTITVKDFANKVKSELLPLNTRALGSTKMGAEEPSRFENISLPEEFRGLVTDYGERIYESPIKTSAGNVHFGDDTENYFAHSRIEDMADGKTRRVIEAQSDLFQKGRLENEGASVGTGANRAGAEAIAKSDPNSFAAKQLAREKEIAKLEPYRNTWHERVIREEVKQAAKDGKTKLQFPTGETAMKIEGLGGERNPWKIVKDYKGEAQLGGLLGDDTLKVGQQIARDNQIGDDWIITDVLGDGKFKAVPKDALVNDDTIKYAKPETRAKYSEIDLGDGEKTYFDSNSSEQFDISGKVDTENPIYRFYDKDIARYLKNKYDAKPVTDERGVTWMEVELKPENGRLPVEAFAAAPLFVTQPKQEQK